MAQHFGQGFAQVLAAALAAMAHGIGGEAVAQNVAVVTVQHCLGQQAMVRGAIIEKQRPGLMLQRDDLLARVEIDRGRGWLERQGK